MLGNRKNRESEIEKALNDAKKKNEELQEEIKRLAEEKERLQGELDDSRHKNEELQRDNDRLQDFVSRTPQDNSQDGEEETKKTEENEAVVTPDTTDSEHTVDKKDVYKLLLDEVLGIVQGKCQNIIDGIARIEDSVNIRLSDAVNKEETSKSKLNDYVNKYEKLYQTVQEDRYRKDKAKLINKMISYVDLMRRMLYDFGENHVEYRLSEDAAFLKKQIENLIVLMDDTLKHEMVSTLPMANQGDAVDGERMEVVDTVETDDVSLDGKVFRSVSACYTWNLPYILKARVNERGDEVRTYNFVLHPEEVIIYKYKKNE